MGSPSGVSELSRFFFDFQFMVCQFQNKPPIYQYVYLLSISKSKGPIYFDKLGFTQGTLVTVIGT